MVSEGTNLISAVISTQYGWIGMVFSERGLRKLTLPCDSAAEAQNKLDEYAGKSASTDNTSVAAISKQLKGYFLRKR